LKKKSLLKNKYSTHKHTKKSKKITHNQKTTNNKSPKNKINK